MDEIITQVPAELVKAEMRALTKDAKLTFNTQQEVPPELLTKIIGNTGKTGWLSFLVGERRIDSLDILTLPDIEIEKGEKTKSQRLRASIYVLWQKEKALNATKHTSEEYYNVKMEQLIDFIKEKIPKD
jgi:hypothetical protein